MTTGDKLVLLLWLLTLMVIGLLFCLRSVRRERRRALCRVAKDIVLQIAGHGIWTGAWLVALHRTRAPHTQDLVRRAAENHASPQSLLDLWEGAGGELIGHVQGPPTESEAEACDWVTRASDELASTPVAGLGAGDRRVVFALVYACGEAPPARPARLRDLRASVASASCIGAAFVACAEDPVAALASSGRARVLAGAAWVFALLSLLTVAYAGIIVFEAGGSLIDSTEGDAGANDAPSGVRPSGATSAPPPAGSTTHTSLSEQTTTSTTTEAPVTVSSANVNMDPKPEPSGDGGAAEDGASSDAGTSSDAGPDAGKSSSKQLVPKKGTTATSGGQIDQKPPPTTTAPTTAPTTTTPAPTPTTAPSSKESR
jgi:hypothetical protein